MNKKTWFAVLLLSISVLLNSVSPVFAATTGFTTWPAQSTSNVKKVWVISFNSPLLKTSVNSNNIYVKDTKQNKVSTTLKLSGDGLTVSVTPAKAYSVGSYNLYITDGLASQAAGKLFQQVVVPFTVFNTANAPITTPTTTPTTTNPTTNTAPTSGNYILNVESTFNSFITNFKVYTTSDVYSVSINKTMKMKYIGKQTYSSGVFGITQGSTVTIQAYDKNNKLLQTYTYQL